nr:putative reverse transcriptase domain-containing protein [Tanacetum cinerariifolium]
MHQRRWIELFSDYDCEIRHHLGKANVVADALSRKERAKPRRVRAMRMTIHSSIKAKILEAQSEAFKNASTRTEMLKRLDNQLERKEDGRLYLVERIRVPVYGNLRTLIMNGSHATRYSIHPGADKMFYDLRGLYWWLGTKKDIAMYVSKCLTCSKVKAEHQKPSGLLQQPEIPEWKWENITMDFVNKLPRARSGHDSNRLTKSAHFLAVREDYKTKKLARLYINEIIARHDEVNDDDKLCFVEEPIEILDRGVKKLKRRWIPIVKVRWNSRRGPEFMWEQEDEMKHKYPHLFSSAIVGRATEILGRNSL